jgi:predicted alpha/beta superfamily hydrolase
MKIRSLFDLSIIALVFSYFSLGAFAKGNTFKAMHGLGSVQYHEVKSTALAQTYHLLVRTPAEYDKSKKYPTVYLLDGGITFPLLSAYYHYLRLADEIPKMIIVGISYDSDDYKTGNNRSRDYTAKSVERTYWGGAPAFSKVIRNQIMPLIEQNYSSDSSKRIIFGQSLGGQFVLYSAMFNPDLFAGYIASNPALHRNLEFFLQDMLTASKKSPLPRLFVSGGADDDIRFRVPALKWMDHWQKQQHPWLLKTKILEGQSHFSAAPEAFRQGIEWVLASSD